MYDNHPMESTVATLVAMAAGALLLFAVQKYGDWRFNSAKKETQAS